MTALEHADIQGNILRAYAFPFARYLFARVRDGEADAARAWLAAQADAVTTAEEWDAKPLHARNVALSFAGLRALGVPGWLLDSFPRDFRQGMAARAADRLGDAGDGAPERWQEGLRGGDVHVLVTVAGQGGAAVGEEADRLRAELAAHGLEPGFDQAAVQRSDLREHFGFTDGFGQPAIARVARHDVPGQGVPIRRWPWTPLRHKDAVRSASDSHVAWRPLRAGEFVLGYGDEDGGPPPAPAPPLGRNATFMVWRKLRQDVAGFRAFAVAAARDTGIEPGLAAARLVGRWPDGSPLVLRPWAGDARLGNDPMHANDFVYGGDGEGFACPRGAHIRRTNPRDGLRAGAKVTARHRMLRRGMPYGEPLADGAPDDGEDRGLVFVSLQASIERQFEIVQAQWLNDGDAFGLGRTPDPLAGAVEAGGARVVFGGRPPRYATAMRAFVTPRGGEYLFVPGIAALRALATL